MWYADRVKAVMDHIIMPWGVVLCVLRLQRANERDLRCVDTGLLTVMFAWVVVPFLLRFGYTFNNVSNWYGHAVVFFAIYAMTREDSAERRRAMLDSVCAGFALFTFIASALLLYTVWTGNSLGDGTELMTFGVYYGRLRPGYDRNILGMNAQCCVMMCMVGACRRKRIWAKAAHAVPCVMMLIVIMLTQSRTSRVAILAGLAVTAYGCAAGGMKNPSALTRQAAGILCAVVTFVGGYAVSGILIEEAVEYYNHGFAWETNAEQNAAEIITQSDYETSSEQETEESGQTNGDEAKKKTLSVYGGTASFYDRIKIWKNLFELWRENPKHLLIGNGIGHTGSLIVKGTLEEHLGAVAVHNTYLQLLADFGIIGGILTLAFFVFVAIPGFRVFYARGDAHVPGGRALCGLVAAILVTGMMESQPLGANTPMNMMLYYALAILCAEGMAIKKA